jgi:hypothetical protein
MQQDKVNLHNDHVSGKIKQLKHEIALAEAEAASINATLQALDGKQLEADEAIQELEDKRLAEQVLATSTCAVLRLCLSIMAAEEAMVGTREVKQRHLTTVDQFPCSGKFNLSW